MREKLRTFIVNDLMRDPDYPLEDDEPLISGGLIDSFSLIELQLYIQSEFGVRIEDTAMTAETSNTLDLVIGLIEERR